MGPKYEFTDETMSYNGHLLHRIRRLSDGKIGGWIEKEENLSQEGNCWVHDDAKVYENAKVYGNAIVNLGAKVYGNAKVYGDAEISNWALVYSNAKVYGKARVFGWAKVYDDAKVCGDTEIHGNAKIYGNVKVYDNAEVYSFAKIYDDAEIYGYAQVYGHANVYGNAKVYGDAEVSDYASVSGNDIVSGNAKVYSDAEFYCNTSVNEKVSSNDSPKEVVQDFIYKVNDSNKLTTQTEYDSVDEFFSTSITNDAKLDTLVICTIDAKEPLIKLQKVETDNKTEFKFIVDIINEDGDNFMFKSIIKSQEQLNQLIQQTIEALKLYPKFSKYVDDLENCL